MPHPTHRSHNAKPDRRRGPASGPGQEQPSRRTPVHRQLHRYSGSRTNAYEIEGELTRRHRAPLRGPSLRSAVNLAPQWAGLGAMFADRGSGCRIRSTERLVAAVVAVHEAVADSGIDLDVLGTSSSLSSRPRRLPAQTPRVSCPSLRSSPRSGRPPPATPQRPIRGLDSATLTDVASWQRDRHVPARSSTCSWGQPLGRARPELGPRDAEEEQAHPDRTHRWGVTDREHCRTE